MTSLANHKKKLALAGAIVVVPLLGHAAVGPLTAIEPPAVARVVETPAESAGIRRIGASYTRVRGGVREVYLEGTPEEIGRRHAALLYDRMAENEGTVWSDFERFVPLAPARALLTDVGRVRYRHVDRGFPDARRRELAAETLAFDPDPFAPHMPTYQRFVFLHALYDIALSFEHSPLIGCSAFGLGTGATADGHALLARAFDFEAGDVFDRDKAVFFVRGTESRDGRAPIPFASVAWPGLVGVLSGMNVEGVSVIVNGGRAREPRTEGEPVVASLRDVLERAHDTYEAVAILTSQTVMVSHIVFVGDARGRFAVVERAPGVDASVREMSSATSRIAVTNHFEGSLRDDPKNRDVEAHTTTLPRRARLDEALSAMPPKSGSVRGAVALLRDHACAGGAACELGDRRAIDALIATHGIVADTTARVLWVSAGPHLSGRFVRFDLAKIFAPGHDPSADPEPETIEEDPILNDGRYREGRARAGGPRIGGDAP